MKAGSARRSRRGRAAGVGHAGDGDGGLLGEAAEVLAHFVRAGGAVQADGVDAKRFQSGDRGADFGAHEHGPGGLDRYLDEVGEADALGDDGLCAAVDSGFGLQEVLAGFDEERVRAAVDEALGLQCEGLFKVVAGGVAEAGALGAGATWSRGPSTSGRRSLPLLRRVRGQILASLRASSSMRSSMPVAK